MMTSPIPALKPVSTGSEIKLATTPRRSTAASISITPTRQASVAAAVSSAAGSPLGTTTASCAPVRIASVVVVLTLSGRELPRMA
jgi:hypothetical protein